MTKTAFEEIMELLDVDLSLKPFEILGALLNAHPDIGTFVEFSDIKSELESSVEGRSLDRSLIHRQLKSLTEEGYVRVDKSGYRHRYMTDISTLANVLEKKIAEYRAFIDKEMNRIDKDIHLLGQTEASELGKSLIELMSGMKTEERPHFASGIDGFIRIYRSEISSRVRKGETIRATVDWLNIETDLNLERFSWLSDLAKRSVKMRVLGQHRPTREIHERMYKIYDILRTQGIDVDYRIRPLKKATYQFVGTSRIGIVLVISENPLASTWIPRHSNPLLIDQAIAAFDRDFETAEAIDLYDSGT